jgi:hypothetical protein
MNKNENPNILLSRSAFLFIELAFLGTESTLAELFVCASAM